MNITSSIHAPVRKQYGINRRSIIHVQLITQIRLWSVYACIIHIHTSIIYAFGAGLQQWIQKSSKLDSSVGQKYGLTSSSGLGYNMSSTWVTHEEQTRVSPKNITTLLFVCLTCQIMPNSCLGFGYTGTCGPWSLCHFSNLMLGYMSRNHWWRVTSAWVLCENLDIEYGWLSCSTPGPLCSWVGTVGVGVGWVGNNLLHVTLHNARGTSVEAFKLLSSSWLAVWNTYQLPSQPTVLQPGIAIVWSNIYGERKNNVDKNLFSFWPRN